VVLSPVLLKLACGGFEEPGVSDISVPGRRDAGTILFLKISRRERVGRSPKKGGGS